MGHIDPVTMIGIGSFGLGVAVYLGGLGRMSLVKLERESQSRFTPCS